MDKIHKKNDYNVIWNKVTQILGLYLHIFHEIYYEKRVSFYKNAYKIMFKVVNLYK